MKDDVVAMLAVDIRIARDQILDSNLFLKAPRLSRLLRFLIEKATSGQVRDISEQAIGVEVFDRDASSYNTNEDPVVRVHVGRLRKKLKAYYETLETDPDIVISIREGSYMPVIRRMNAVRDNFKLAIHPFKCISHHANGEAFTHGLHDELMHQLCGAFEKNIVAHPSFRPDDANNEMLTSKRVSGAAISHWLEGSVKIDHELIRASARLIDTLTGSVIWSVQFNRNVTPTIALQEELAASICAALKNIFRHR